MNKLTRGLKACLEPIKPSRYQGGGHVIHCLQCGGEFFQKQDSGLLGLGTILICDRCGMSQLYGKKPEPMVG